MPAFNASGTVIESLESVSHQTYDNLDIIVVDDGSIDETGTLVRGYQAHDARIRLIHKPNGGVASARNAGIAAALGEFVAFIDADDLWHPTKIAKQMAALLASGPETALVYAPFRVIDVDGHVLSSPRRFNASGWVLYRHFHANLVGNGSSILVRKKHLDELGGFDTGLRASGAEGCEDLLLQLRIAARHRFVEIPEYLVGYRRHPSRMSNNAEQMIRSGKLALRIALAECADIPHLSPATVLNRYEWQGLKSAARQRQIGKLVGRLWRHYRISPDLMAVAFWTDYLLVGPRLLEHLKQTRQPCQHFYDHDPSAGADVVRPLPRFFRRLTILDQSYRPSIRPDCQSIRSTAPSCETPARPPELSQVTSR
jgi:glycosyltransferase involved in cell wall biosynthesis